MNRLDAQRAILAKVNECIALARSLYPNYIAPAPAVKFALRGRSCGGTALADRELDFNLDWYATDPARFLSIVVPHEVAHIVDEALYPTTPRAVIRNGRVRRVREVQHGRTWVRICLALGGDGQRTSNIATGVARARRTREFRYTSILGREVWLGPTHHKKLQARGDILLNGRPIYYVTHATNGQVHKAGFTGECRMKA
jgi:hypothetical protein